MIYRISINFYRYEYRIEKTDRYPALLGRNPLKHSSRASRCSRLTCSNNIGSALISCCVPIGFYTWPLFSFSFILNHEVSLLRLFTLCRQFVEINLLVYRGWQIHCSDSGDKLQIGLVWSSTISSLKLAGQVKENPFQLKFWKINGKHAQKTSAPSLSIIIQIFSPFQYFKFVNCPPLVNLVSQFRWCFWHLTIIKWISENGWHSKKVWTIDHRVPK